MSNEEFVNMKSSLISQMQRYPNCKIANCDCNSKEAERIGECHCLCHIEEIKKGWKKK